MAAPVKDGKVWRHRVMIAGVRHTGTFPTKAHAVAWEADKRVSGGAAVDSTRTCADAFDRYEREVSKSKRGYKWESLRLAAFSASSLGAVRLTVLSSADIAAWRDERLRCVSGRKNKGGELTLISNGSVTREMNLLSHVFSVARKEWKWIQESPTKDVARPRAAPHRDRRITQEEIEKICLQLDWAHDAHVAPASKKQRIALAFLFAIETAMRAGEICALVKDDVTGRVARLHTTKNGLPRNVPLSQRAVQIWSLVPEGFELTPASLDAMFRRARDGAGIEGLTFHDTRHEAITRLAAKIGVLDLARMVGHSDIKQLQTYYNATADDIAGRLD